MFRKFQLSTTRFGVIPNYLVNVRFSSSSSTTTTQDEEEKPDLSVVSTAAAISRSLRKFRQEGDTSDNADASSNSWVDVESLLSSKYLSRMDLTDKTHDTSATSTSSILRPIQIAEEILSGSSVFKAAGLELKPQLVVRLRTDRSRQAHIFLDSEHFSCPEECVDIFTSLNVHPDHSTLQVVRQPHQKQSSAVNNTFQQRDSKNTKAPYQHQHFRNFGKRLCELAQVSPQRYAVGDDVSVYTTATEQQQDGGGMAYSGNNDQGVKRKSATEYNALKKVKNYMLIEKLAAQLFASQTVTLADIIYICSDENFDLYVNHVARSTLFYDAEVYVYSPSFSKKIVF